jgi:HK97 family phage prohead protease
MVDRHALIDAPERRSIALGSFELRDADGDKPVLTGYASIFDHPYDVYGGPTRGGWTERVDPRAFDVTLAAKPDLHLLINHAGMPLARTKSGTLTVSADARGLAVRAPLDVSDPDVQRLLPKMRRGDMDEMSFAFRTKADTWSDDDTQRTLTEVSLHKGDVSVVNWGANPATSAEVNSLRSALEFLTGVSPEEALAEMRALGEDAPARLLRASEALSTIRRTLTPPKAGRRLSVAEALAVIGEELDL